MGWGTDRYVLRHVDTEAHDVPGLPHAAVEMVKEKFSTLTSHVLTQQTSADGSTTKLLIRLQVRLWQFRYNPSASYQEWFWIQMNAKYQLHNRNCVHEINMFEFAFSFACDWSCSCIVCYRDEVVTLNVEIDHAAESWSCWFCVWMYVHSDDWCQ